MDRPMCIGRIVRAGLLICLGLLASGSAIGIQSEFLGLHFVARGVKLDKAKRLVDLARVNGYTHIVVQLADAVALDEFPGELRADAISKSDFLELVDYIRFSGLEFIPEIKLLTHQEKFFKNSQLDLMYNKSTYDPNNDQVYKIVYNYLDELIHATDPSFIHIGHDEVAGLSIKFREKWLYAGERVLPSDLFYSDVLKIYDYLQNKGIRIGMWGDMLISPKEKSLSELQAVHGIPQGYGPSLRKRLPRDIVIFDWHYKGIKKQFVGSLDLFLGDGYEVIASVWDDRKSTANFVGYIKEKSKPRVLVTLWYHLQHENWDLIESIVENSAEIYRN